MIEYLKGDLTELTPTTATIEFWQAPPALYWILQIEFDAAFAAMEIVPNEETRLELIRFPKLYMDCSIPLGIPMRKIALIIDPLGR